RILGQRGRAPARSGCRLRVSEDRTARWRSRAREVIQLRGPPASRRSSGRMVLVRSLLMATAISLAFSLFLTPVFLKGFRRIGWGQVIRTPEDIANPSHEAKRGTPTMGGVIFILGTIVGYFAGTFFGGMTPGLSAIL